VFSKVQKNKEELELNGANHLFRYVDNFNLLGKGADFVTKLVEYLERPL
jgi:hypothetical protein